MAKIPTVLLKSLDILAGRDAVRPKDGAATNMLTSVRQQTLPHPALFGPPSDTAQAPERNADHDRSRAATDDGVFKLPDVTTDIYPFKDRHPPWLGWARMSAVFYALVASGPRLRLAFLSAMTVPWLALFGLGHGEWPWALLLNVALVAGAWLWLYLFAPTSVLKVPANHQIVLDFFGRIAGRVVRPGPNLKLPDFLVTVRQVVDGRLQHMDCTLRCKTADDVALELRISVHFQIEQAETFVQVKEPFKQIVDWLRDRVQAEVAKLTFDETFEVRDRLQAAIVGGASRSSKAIVAIVLESYGIRIAGLFVNEPMPNENVRRALDEKATLEILAKAEQCRAEAIAKAKSVSLGTIARELSDFCRQTGWSVEQALTLFEIHQNGQTLVEASEAGGTLIFWKDAPRNTSTLERTNVDRDLRPHANDRAALNGEAAPEPIS